MLLNWGKVPKVVGDLGQKLELGNPLMGSMTS